MRALAARGLTAFAVAGLCVAAVFQGGQLVRADLVPFWVTALDGQKAFHWWLSVPDLATSAPKIPSSPDWQITDSAKAYERGKQLAVSLVDRPLSSASWAALAKMQQLGAQPPQKIAPTFYMSVLTGPDEGYAMIQRGLIGVSMWEILAPESHRRIAADIAGAFIPLTEVEKSALRESLASKTAAVREDIRNALLAERLPANAMARIGL